MIDMTPRITKKRKLEKAGLSHVAGWLEAKDAAKVAVKIDEAKAKVKEALENECRIR